ncbi:Leukemia-associated protein 7 [Buceros rhinoceros silvestris]|uniref:Leukemia-associated protein 7 n=1 Tax=Buceros rhinoceros silvestris TaxID=175836 RepID=A0A091GTM1_BUCRH|nr:Leukemia-associated protein 7 [Buceros rhinoceros silvestris]
MAGLATLLVSIGHRAGAFHTLWAATAPHHSCSPPQPSHNQTFSTVRSGTAWHSPGEKIGLCKPSGTPELEAERKTSGESPKEGAENGDLSPLNPGEPRPEKLAQPGLARCETLQETALCSKMSRLVEATSQLVQVEQTLLLPLLQQQPLPLHPKIRERHNIEFRNICSHMVLQKEGHQFERDLSEACQCLKTIIEKLICSLAIFSSDFYIPVRAALRQSLQNILAM